MRSEDAFFGQRSQPGNQIKGSVTKQIRQVTIPKRVTDDK